ncbi:hypothetical protein FO519_003862 [Halicephalobus sp. NKZ332]|nr:hypothetical protein FO519_003862 [Halicephalobus sp. NKZ332]
MRLALLSVTLASFVLSIWGISYRCENDQVLIVQSFGNDTIRMHCQKLDLCGNQNLKCNYDHEQPSCGGKNNFVSNVNQVTPTGPVLHTCCQLQQAPGESILGHDGNDCFVYELPDGSHSNSADAARKRKIHSVDYSEFTVLQNVNQIPEQFDGYAGYRMKLFLLKNKSPPSLIVKAIERLPDGYRVTICRPRCGNFHSEGIIGRHEKTENSPKTISGDIMHGKIQSPAEWAAASWSSWSSSSWSSWSTSKFVGEEEENENKRAREGTRGDRVNAEGSGLGSGSNAQSWNQASFEPSKESQGVQPVSNNINVQAHGGTGGQGGAGGQGFGGSVNIHPSGQGVSLAGANGTGIGVGVGGQEGQGSQGGQKGQEGQGGEGNQGGQGGEEGQGGKKGLGGQGGQEGPEGQGAGDGSNGEGTGDDLNKPGKKNPKENGNDSSEDSKNNKPGSGEVRLNFALKKKRKFPNSPH